VLYLEGAGTSEIHRARGGTRARYFEHLVVRAALARRAGILARPLIHTSHAHLMRVGERGLARYLGAPDPLRP